MQELDIEIDGGINWKMWKKRRKPKQCNIVAGDKFCGFQGRQVEAFLEKVARQGTKMSIQSFPGRS